VSIEEVAPGDITRWDSPSFQSARAFGDRWYDERRTLVPIAPSVVTPVERNVVINQEHRESRIRASQPKPVRWDATLWKK
jgi:RES domain-containing protein